MPIAGQDLIINRSDMTDARVISTEHPDTPPDGQALLKVDCFALTANTITYGVASDSLGYWNFFPSDRPGFGRIPAWGFAEVIASRVPDLAVGRRLYGYVPMSTHLMMEPGKIGAHGVTDMAAHRQPMAPIYNHYAFTDTDPGYAPNLEAQIALFRPLFTTSFLLGDFLRENDAFGARRVLLSSASSKTALGLAADLAHDRPKDVQVVGLTSAGNLDFVKRLGLYDQVLSYDAVNTLPQDPAAYVDFSGNGTLLRAIHGHFGDQMRHTAQVGLTDWQNAELRVPDLPGPKPTFFFAPQYAQKRLADWGRDGFQHRLAEAWAAFIATTGWLQVVQVTGPDAVRQRYLSALAGTFDPSQGEMLSLWA